MNVWLQTLKKWFAMVGEAWTSFLSPFRSYAPQFRPPDESLGPARPGEVRPPWIEYPGYEPGDGFWRQTGEYWFHEYWLPYYDSLSPEQQREYREYWEVPEVWWSFYFDPAWREFLDHVDDPEGDHPSGAE